MSKILHFVLDGQSLTLTTVDINPAHTRFGFAADENNPAWLRWPEFHMVNEHGERFDPPAPGAGIRRFRTSDSMMMDVHFLETAFFTQSERLYMVIEEVTWLDKDMEFVHIFEDTPGLFFNVENPPIDGADGTTVSLTPQYSRIVRLETPMVIRIR